MSQQKKTMGSHHSYDCALRYDCLCDKLVLTYGKHHQSTGRHPRSTCTNR